MFTGWQRNTYFRKQENSRLLLHWKFQYCKYAILLKRKKMNKVF